MADLSSHNRIVVDQHNQQATGYASLSDSIKQTDRATQLRERIGVSADSEVLDVACGPARMTLELAPHARRVTGLDLTPGMLAQAREALAQRKLDNVTFVQGDAAALPFADASFDIVLSSAAFHHFEQPAKVLAEMVRVCRAGGRVVISDVTPEEGKAAEYDRIERMRDGSHKHAHSVAELTALGTRSGLEPPQTYTSLTGPMPFASVLATSFPERHSRDELLEIMRDDAAGGQDRLGFKAELADGEVMVTYPMSQVVWMKG